MDICPRQQHVKWGSLIVTIQRKNAALSFIKNDRTNDMYTLKY